jgi:hypothetical protein
MLRIVTADLGIEPTDGVRVSYVCELCGVLREFGPGDVWPIMA